MKAFALVLAVAAAGVALACGGSEHKIGGSSAPIGSGGAQADGAGGTGDNTGGSGQGGTVASGGVGGAGVGGGVATGGVGGSIGSTGGGPAAGGSSGSGTGGSSTTTCTDDSDCRAFAFYCTGCDCLALAVGEADPRCPGDGVQCFADACMNKVAVCEAGMCQIQENNCPVGQTQRNICLSCGPAGGCGEMGDVCTKTCSGSQDCVGFTYPFCADGLCQAGGCI